MRITFLVRWTGRFGITLAVAVICCAAAWGQAASAEQPAASAEQPAAPAEEQAVTTDQPAEKTPAPKGLEPVFPAERPNLLFVEAEDAVSTNFAREPVLNFGVSGFRALQLNRWTGLEGVGSFYADYVFTLPSPGTWELWYGGTPPGPKDESSASYASPLILTLDGGEPLTVSRERVSVIENYSPVFYWNRAGDFTLEARRHTIRFEITEKRRIDGRYFFYLDCFFFVKKEDGARLAIDPVPAVFPGSVNERMTDAPMPSIDDALIKVRDNPGATEPLVDISRLYTMLGDYLNALKYLNKAAALKPNDPDIALLIAKNRIWKGDLADGLAKYRDVLTQDPTRRALWLEAGKVAAWNGRYAESISLLSDGLAAFPDDPDLTVNLGLTYLWGGRGKDAENTFRAAQGLAGADAARLKDLARVYRVNGYPDRAVQTYTAAVNAAPQDLDAYLQLIDTQLAMGRTADAEAVKKRISDTFVPSDRLTSFMAAFDEKAGLKDRLLEEYNAKLARNPDNLVLRQVLAQSYFWNGMKDKAVGEYRHILANYAYLQLARMDARSPLLPQTIDRGYVLSDYLSRFPAMAKQAREALEARLWKYMQAATACDAAQKSLDSALQAQGKAKEADAAQVAVQNAEDKLLAAEGNRAAAADALTALVASGSALATRYAGVVQALDADAQAAESLAAEDAEAHAVFEQSTKANGWGFDASGELAELAQDLADNDLSRIVSAKITLADRQTAKAQAALAPDKDSRSASSAAYTLMQAGLWAGKARDAVAIIERLSADPGDAVLPAYFADLAALAASLAGVPGADAADPLADAEAVSDGLITLEKEASKRREALQKSLARLHVLYRRAVTRTFYAFEQEVSSIRNELGDYYLAGEPAALDPAIRQFRRVLAVDPGDLNATFRLGKVYEWKRDWASAMDAYRIVYKADPYFENVATLYNHLERAHADTLSASASASADAQRMQWHAETTWSHSFSSVFGYTASYQVDDIRIVRSNDASGADHTSYTVHDVSLGLPLDLYLLNVKLTPWIGGLLQANGLYQKTDATGATITSGADAFQAVSAAEPYARLDVSAGAWNTLFLYGTARWGRQAETLDPARGAALYDASGEASLTTMLSGIDVWPLRDTSLRTYGRMDWIHTAGLAHENTIYTALQEININLLKGGSPYGVLALGGGASFQHSDEIEPYLYYTPSDVLLAGGSLTGSLWIGAKNGDVLGISLRGYGGSYQEGILGASPSQWIKAEGQADLSLTSGNATWTLTALGSATYKLATSAWDYWSLYLKLGYTMKMPDLLAQ